MKKKTKRIDDTTFILKSWSDAVFQSETRSKTSIGANRRKEGKMLPDHTAHYVKVDTGIYCQPVTFVQYGSLHGPHCSGSDRISKTRS